MSLDTQKPFVAMDVQGKFRLHETQRETSGKHTVLLAVLTKKGAPDSIALKNGQKIEVTSALTKNQSQVCVLDVAFITPSRYYRPGDKITSCLVGVHTGQWTSVVNALKQRH
jgi:hypothetical protein